MDLLLLAEVVTAENAGTAGMVGVAFLLASSLKLLITYVVERRNGKNGKKKNNPHSEMYSITKAEAAERDKTRKRVWQLYRWVEEERADLKENTKQFAKLVSLSKATKETLDRIERKLEMRNRGTR